MFLRKVGTVITGALFLLGSISATPISAASTFQDDVPGYTDISEWHCQDWMQIAAASLNIEFDELLNKFEQGHSIAELAAEADLDIQSIIDAIITAETELVESTRLQLAEMVADFVNDDEFNFGYDYDFDFDDEFNFGYDFDFDFDFEDEFNFDDEFIFDFDFGQDIDWLEDAAAMLGMDFEQLWMELGGGISIADIATNQGIDVQALIDAIVDDSVDAELLALPELVVEFVEMTFDSSDLNFGHDDDEFTFCDGFPFCDDEDAFFAGCNDVSVEIVDESIVVEGLSFYAESSLTVTNLSDNTVLYQCTDSCLDPEIVTLPDDLYKIEIFATNENSQCSFSATFSHGDDEDGDNEDSDEQDGDNEGREDNEWFEDENIAGADWFEIISNAISLDEEMLWAELAEGKPISAIVAERNVDQVVVVDAITDIERQFVDKAVEFGLLSEEDANFWLDSMAAIINEILDESFVETDEPTGDDTGGDNTATIPAIQDAANAELRLRKVNLSSALGTPQSNTRFTLMLPLVTQ